MVRKGGGCFASRLETALAPTLSGSFPGAIQHGGGEKIGRTVRIVESATI